MIKANLWNFDLLINDKWKSYPVVHVWKVIFLWQISDKKGLFLRCFVVPRGSKGEFITQYDNKCKYAWCYWQCCWCLWCKIKGITVLMSFLSITFEWTLVCLITLEFKLGCWQKQMWLIMCWYWLFKGHVCRSQKAHTPHMGSHFDTSIACAVYLQRASTMHLFDIHWLSHTVNIHLPLHSLEVFMIAITRRSARTALST